MPETPLYKSTALNPKVVIAVVLLACLSPFVVFGGLLFWFWRAVSEDFADKTIVQTTSPNGKRTAVLFSRDGGATEWFHRFVIVCDGSGGCTADGKNNITEERSTGISSVRWSGNDKLLIYYSPSHTHFDDKQATKDGVKIVYVPTGK